MCIRDRPKSMPTRSTPSAARSLPARSVQFLPDISSFVRRKASNPWQRAAPSPACCLRPVSYTHLVGTFCNQTARNTTSDDESRRNVDQQVFKVSQCKKVFCKKANKNCKKQNQNNNCVVGQKVSYAFCSDWFTFGLHLYHSHFLLIQTV